MVKVVSFVSAPIICPYCGHLIEELELKHKLGWKDVIYTEDTFVCPRCKTNLVIEIKEAYNDG